MAEFTGIVHLQRRTDKHLGAYGSRANPFTKTNPRSVTFSRSIRQCSRTVDRESKLAHYRGTTREWEQVENDVAESNRYKSEITHRIDSSIYYHITSAADTRQKDILS
ncbi:hypothetical protein CBL_08159 [Carabus blaptoides fortunei]